MHGALSKWDSVSDLLKNVSRSTLPSSKLRAIVDAAGELYRIQKSEAGDASCHANQLESKDLGADDFLPIFIFCVMRAEMERPSALCKFCCGNKHLSTPLVCWCFS